MRRDKKYKKKQAASKEWKKELADQIKHPVKLEKPIVNRNSVLMTTVIVIIMTAITIYSWRTADEGREWFWLSAVFIIAAVLVNLFRFHFSILLEALLSAFAPAAVFMLVESYTHLLSQMWEGPVQLNLIIYYLFFGFMMLILGRPGWAIIAGSALLAAAGLANYFVILFRSSPILPWDLYSIGVAASVADNFEYTLTVRACNVILLFILLWMLCAKMRIKMPDIKFRLAGAVVFLAAMLVFGGYVQTDAAAAAFKMDTTLFTPNVLYRNNGLVLSFMVNMRYLKVEKPSDYSQDTLDVIQEELKEDGHWENVSVEAGEPEEMPNIIVIMNEAFSDLRVLGDYETNTEVMPFIDALSENTQKGWVYASVKGGNTANTEFEFLTGLSMYYLPTGSIPYQQYIRSDIPALSSQLKSLGYTSVALHPYYASGWNREKIYQYMGFDEMYFKSDFNNPETLRTYVSDLTTYEKIIERYEEKNEDERMFFFDVTMQNHGSYTRSYDNFTPDVSVVGGSGYYLAATEQYLSLIKRSDEAFEQLVGYFSSQEEPTIILMFGDHQPADYVVSAIDDGKTEGEWYDFTESEELEDWSDPTGITGTDRKERYKVPYIMWANYDIQESEGEETSANYLALRLLKAAGLPLTDFQKYLDELEETIPVLSAKAVHLLMPEEGGLDNGVLKELWNKYNILQYNDLFDGKHRLQNFFGY
ncbi:MAG: LTA synthase family protein [Coprococcus sp.]